MPRDEIEPTDGQIEIAAKALNAHYSDSPEVDDDHRECARKMLVAALNYEEPYGPEDEKYDFALHTTDMVSGDGTYAAVNLHNPDPGVQRAIQRWRER